VTPRAQSRTTPCNRQQAGQRLRQAEGFLRWAQAALADKGDEVNLDVAASLAVLAGIAASDALCGKALGYYSRGQSHADAANLIRSIQPGGTDLAGRFTQLVANKNDAQYAPETMGESSAKAAVRQAADLVSGAKTQS
jgi:hypothetical protein